MRRRTTALAALLVLLGHAAQAQADAAIKVLMDQANYWYAQNRPEDAAHALDRVLQLDPDNPDALGLLAQIEAQRGDRVQAAATLTHLRSIRPNDPRIARVEETVRAGSIDPAGLAEARHLAQEGRNAEAIARYERLFHGARPPAMLAVEYYNTLSGTEGGWAAARTGLAEVVAASPQDMHAQFAYAQLLTYRDQTRMEGVQRLAVLAHNPETAAAAAKAWRQALEWMPVDASSVPAYEAWLADHPNDADISGRLQQARNPPRSPADEAALKRSAGFAALNGGRLQDAETAFTTVLAQAAQDPDALGGLGLVRLRQGKVADARALLARAIAADPLHKARWEAALQGASVGEDYAAARTMVEHGQLDAAERQLRAIISSGGDVSGARLMLADVLARRGNLGDAETQYRAALARQPNNPDALVGLAQVLNRQGRGSEAEALLDRAQSAGNGRAAGRIRADALRQQAAMASDSAAKEALLRAAASADPTDPWIRLDLARALLSAGKKAEARQIMAEVTAPANPGVDALRAGAMFASEDGRPGEAAALVNRLPAASRTADMRALLAQATRQKDIRNAIGLAALNPIAAHEKLLALAAQPDPDGTNGVAVARAFLEMGNAVGAREALATAQAATPNPSPAQRLAYAGLLMQAGDERGAQALIQSLDGASGLTVEQTNALSRLRAGAAIREADRLNGEHQQAAAYDVLAPALARAPDDPDLNLAVGRLFAGADEPRRALAINQAVLERDPANLDARRAAVEAAIQTSDWARAEALVRDGIAAAPDDSRVWVMSATLHRARGEMARAYADLKRAQSLRKQEIGSDPQSASSLPGAARRPPALETAGGDGRDALRPANPFRRGDVATPSTSLASTFAASSAPSSDPLLLEIDRQVAAVQEDLAPKFTIGPSFRTRTGTSGLDQLNEIDLPTDLVARPIGAGRMTVSATPTFLSSGTVPLDTVSQSRFGTGAFGLHPAPTSQHAEGVGLALAYQTAWAKADVGTSPIGFPQQNVLGGIELSPQVAQGVRLRLVGERRAVTDSVLSYAGTKDPATGIAWGGVTRTRGHAQLELSFLQANVYAGGGYAALSGQNVVSNHEYEFGAGGSYPVWRGPNDELRLGLDIVYFAYDKNTDFFTLGQGGYFSPQSYFATLLPLKYTARTDELTWSIGGSIGFQSYNEHSSSVFPASPQLQGALEAESALVPTQLQTSFPGQSASGPVGGAQGSVEYHVNESFVLGGQASYQHAGNWSEMIGQLYGRYIFGGGIR
ncbi:MAG TPA: cellulose synthase subunit BcsC-related outer membrane protein [Rhodopila sp.]